MVARMSPLALGVWFVGRYVPDTRERNFLDVNNELWRRWSGNRAPAAAGGV